MINSKEEIISAYESGEGGFTVRCKYKVEKLAKGQWQIIVYELPPSCSASSLSCRLSYPYCLAPSSISG